MNFKTKKLVVFDFCETLVDFQTADAFIDFVTEKELYNKFKYIKYLTSFLTQTRVLAFFNKFFHEWNVSKRLKLYQIKGISEEKINQYSKDFYEEKLMRHLIKPLYALFLKHSNEGSHVIIISGGYEPYIRFFSEKHNIDYYFATKIAFEKNKVSGFFLGKDCLFKQKVVLLEQYIAQNNITFEESIVYTDSVTDIPILKWAKSAFVVSKNKPQIWAKEMGFNEIIWEND